MLLCAFLCVGVLSFGQTVTKEFANVSLKNVLKEVEKQTGMSVMYEKGDVDENAMVSGSFSNASLQSVLSTVLPKTLSFSVEDKIIVIFKASANANVAPGRGRQAQQANVVRGTIVDQTGAPVMGATVLIQGTTTFASSDLDGSFEIEVPKDGVLVISYIGFNTQNVPVQGRSQIDIVLVEESQYLEELVVVGYGVQRKSDVTGAISQVKAEEMENRTTESIGHALQGKVAGVQILNSSGAPGSSTSIRVRGYSSNSTSATEPLYIVDGLKVSSIDYLDISSVESVEILKDAASAAIYGAEAGNGVVLITTAKGKTGAGRVFYNMQYSVSSLAHEAEVMNAQDYYDYQTVNGFATSMSSWDKTSETNWQDAVYGNGLFQRHTVGVQGGNEKASFFASLSYLNNKGMIVGDKDYNKRLSGQLNASYQINKWFNVAANVSIDKSESGSVAESSDQGNNVAGAARMDPLTPIEYTGALPSHVQNALDAGYNLITNPETGNYYGLSSVQEDAVNPFISIYRNDAWSQRFNVRGTLAANLTPFKGFTFTSRLGYRFGSGSSSGYNRPYFATSVTSSTTYSVSAGASTNNYYQWENFANYNRTFGKHTINAMAGMSFQEAYSMSVTGSVDKVTNVEMENWRYISNATTDAVKTISGGTPSTSAQIGYFGRLGWAYDNRYNVQVNFRADAFDSSKLSSKSRWGYFPSASIGWTLSNESFMQDIDRSALSLLKFRASYGKNGNIGVLSGYAYSTALTTSSTIMYPIDGAYIQQTTTGTRLPNPDLRWEESVQLDLGLDSRFLNDRLSFTADFYSKNTEGLLLNATPPLITGATSIYKNLGKVHNHGFEFELGWRDSHGDFSYSINANLATLNNKVMDLGGLSRQAGATIHLTTATYFEEGYPVWYYYGYTYTGVGADGYATYKDLDGDGQITTEDRGYIGDALPDFTYGLTLNFAWKGLDLVVFGSGVQGSTIWYVMNRPQLNVLSTFWNDSYSKVGAGAKYPIPSNVTLDKLAFSTAALFDGSYFKIKQMQLGYTLPRRWTQKISVSSFRAYVSLDNYFTFTSYPGMDPETMTNTGSAMGLDKGGYPVAKNVAVGVNISF